ncbi:MAG: hypothetical protein K8F91_02900 [Candidatus Obscuribacterales bacterium]|nr:hypothetical protein [Candidatus Obscuribacterales bacterium]
MPHELKNLSTTHPEAKSKISEMRDTAENADNRDDWIILNGVLGDNARAGKGE